MSLTAGSRASIYQDARVFPQYATQADVKESRTRTQEAPAHRIRPNRGMIAAIDKLAANCPVLWNAACLRVDSDSLSPSDVCAPRVVN
jgi:hypothetical protein